MTTLPPVLARWARELAELPAPLVAALGPWLGRLALAVGPMPGDRRADAGELDGVEGLARRGSYERLLISEWAIADELPDEFLRRAAGGEHLFVARAHRAEPHQRRSVVLLSAGPSQLGAPRLVHVAALVVMARRAAAAGAVLAWGVLERPEAGLAPAVDADAIDRLLRARTTTTAGAAHVDGWRAAMDAGDRWLVGGDEHAEVARALGASLLAVRDPLDPAVAALDVEVRFPDSTRPRARVRLPLPPPAAAAGLLRGLGSAVRGRGARIDRPARRMAFLLGGRRLAIDLGDRVEVWPVPSSPREPAGNPRVVRVPADETLIALGMRRRTSLIVSVRAGEPEFVRIRDAARGPDPQIVALPAEVAAQVSAGVRPPPGIGFAYQLDVASTPSLVFAGPTGAMLVASPHPRTGAFAITLLGRNVPATGGLRVGIDGLVYGQLRPGAVEIVRHGADGVEILASVERTLTDGDDPGVRWGTAVPSGPAWGPIAIRVDDTRWDVIADGLGSTTIETTAAVHGVLVRGDDVWLVGGDGGIVLRNGHTAVPLLAARAPILDGLCAPKYPVAAYVTEREIVVYSLQLGQELLRIAQVAS